MKFFVGPEVFSVDLEPWAHFLDSDPVTRKFFLSDKGEHYKLLAYLASQLAPVDFSPVDIGTATGASALALQSAGHGCVSYDIDHSKVFGPIGALVQLRTEDGVAAMERKQDASLILLDVDPHQGALERECVARLLAQKWSGILVCDDIHLNENMEQFWSDVSLPKWDVTPYGHFTGTGIIGFGGAEVEVRDV